jgi:2-dehydro-3-deoxygluconokinase
MTVSAMPCARAGPNENIGLGMVQRLPGRLPGLYCIQTDAAGERRFLYWRNEAAVRDCFTTPAAAPILAALPDYDVLYFSGITLAVLGVQGREKLLETLIEARQRDARIVFDNNYRPRLWDVGRGGSGGLSQRVAVCRPGVADGR